ncbi:transmembrane emp24 domain-containing protein 9 [Myriangium duriaei CBS 260.36]|uniref:Transmembrane emp24 domain-containing protein 9 n=1 Tax=Myriangium duriaei CBS 260.36 TaxID=1168546 RepID=A0A9P4IXF3_9PEZI|nr:transmembrane emp24 domain-containing protein 9 [Myriangium duriaei CBS 260.36]
MKAISSLVALAALASHVSALYFYIDGPREKCFFEELPKDTLVVGHYNALLYNDQSHNYGPHNDMGLYISVEEVFDNHHRIVSQRGSSKGQFTFSAADSGEHRICFTPTGIHGSTGFFGGGHERGNVKLEVDIAIGETSKIESSDKEKMGDLTTKIRDLNARLQDIRREQIFQREREAEFRDQSESVNARVVRWTLIQLAVLGVTCAWQLSHLRSFFIKQKLT